MTIVYALLLVAALVCFILAAFKAVGRVQLVACGLAFWVLVPLIQMLHRV